MRAVRASMIPFLGCCGLLVLGAEATGYADAGPFDFSATLRVDLHHVGDHLKESYLVDELRREGPWPGSRENLLDTTGFGSQRAEVTTVDKTRRLVYSFGFCTLFSEWRTTSEARTRGRVFSETVRLPFPTETLRLTLLSRNAKGAMVPIAETLLDPASPSISLERRRGGLPVHRIRGRGEPPQSLDIVVLGDGYERWQSDKYRADVERFSDVLLGAPPFDRFRERINVWAVTSPSRQSGIDEPRKGLFKDTALGLTFNTFGQDRYLMTEDNKALRDVAANAPYDAIVILGNTSRYGGGGIYRQYASFVSDNEYDEYILVHEFGHSFAGLGDEYYTSAVAYNDLYPRGVEPWEPNITAETRRERLKWGRLVAPGTPIPTPADDPRFQQSVGLFEGAGYSAKGLYRAFPDCKMFGKAERPFCPVCMDAVSRMIEATLR